MGRLPTPQAAAPAPGTEEPRAPKRHRKPPVLRFTLLPLRPLLARPFRPRELPPERQRVRTRILPSLAPGPLKTTIRPEPSPSAKMDSTLTLHTSRARAVTTGE